MELEGREAEKRRIDACFTGGKPAVWDDDAGSLLDLAERAGLSPEFSCRSGICNTCRCGIREGEVDYVEEPLDPPPAGHVLICCSRPRGRIVLDL